MLTLFLVFIITKGALTLYNGITIGRGAIRVGDTAQSTNCAPSSIIRIPYVSVCVSPPLAVVMATDITDGYNPWIFWNPSSVVNFFGKMENAVDAVIYNCLL